MTVEEQLLEILHTLAPEQQAEVLDFAEFLRRRSKPTIRLPATALKPLPILDGPVPSGWRDAIYDHSRVHNLQS
jgi:hypothetical protein